MTEAARRPIGNSWPPHRRVETAPPRRFRRRGGQRDRGNARELRVANRRATPFHCMHWDPLSCSRPAGPATAAKRRVSGRSGHITPCRSSRPARRRRRNPTHHRRSATSIAARGRRQPIKCDRSTAQKTPLPATGQARKRKGCKIFSNCDFSATVSRANPPRRPATGAPWRALERGYAVQ
jgi:hypothetical protein